MNLYKDIVIIKKNLLMKLREFWFGKKKDDYVISNF